MTFQGRPQSLIALIGFIAACGAAMGQPAEVPHSVKPACPPDVSANGAPTVGRATPNLSDKLSESKGIICPPGAVDPEMTVRPPHTGDMKVIPPPGSPGGDPNLHPK
jgi:hypothetical protein